MALISLAKAKEVIPEFIDERLMPNAPIHVQGALAASVFILSYNNYKPIMDLVMSKKPLLMALGILNDKDQIDIEMAKGAINAYFAKAPSYSIMNFVFNQDDGNALVAILEKHKD